MIIVSNRLPISVKKVDGKLSYEASGGGLATGLSSYTTSKKSKWIGWPGIASDDLTEHDKEAITTELAKSNCYPLFLTKKQVTEFYNGYSNEILWPLLHNLPFKLTHEERFWKTYHHVNQLFTDMVINLSQPEDKVWVHDYQLLLMPQMLRIQHPDIMIGFFLHVPFPSPKVFSKITHHKRLIKGMLGSNVVGFHTTAYTKNFLANCQEFALGTVENAQVILPDHVAKVSAFPLGIDYEKFAAAGKLREVKRETKKQKKKYRRQKVILTVDRLEPTKGFIERLEAFREFLATNPKQHRKVVLVMLAVPSRSEIKAYQVLKQKVELLVDSINKEFGTKKWTPIHYMYKSVPFEELAALYRVADVAFVAPIKDGMNLVAKEYIASNHKRRGVLILSQNAGAAQELKEALIVNPKQPATLVNALTKAVTMPRRELKHRLKTMQNHLEINNVHAWKKSFVKTMQTPVTIQNYTKRLSDTVLDTLIHDFRAAKHPAIILDYDGVLAAFVNNPRKATPTAEVNKMLKNLAHAVDNKLLLISGRTEDELNEWFSDLPISVAAEHGAFLRSFGHPWRSTVELPADWKHMFLPVLEKYARKTPGAFVEEKKHSIVWHYRKASTYYAQKHLTILKRVLNPILQNYGLTLYKGNMILEIKPPASNKGTAVQKWLDDTEDFVLCIGDDYTDESMFAAAAPDAYTIKVGRGRSLAKYRLKSPVEVLQLLQQLAKNPN